MIHWLELALVAMLGLASLCLVIQVYYIWVCAQLVHRLATDCVHLKLLVSLAASDLARHGVLVMEDGEGKLTDAQKTKMN